MKVLDINGAVADTFAPTHAHNGTDGYKGWPNGAGSHDEAFLTDFRTTFCTPAEGQERNILANSIFSLRDHTRNIGWPTANAVAEFSERSHMRITRDAVDAFTATCKDKKLAKGQKDLANFILAHGFTFCDKKAMTLADKAAAWDAAQATASAAADATNLTIMASTPVPE